MSEKFKFLDVSGLKTHFAGDEEMIGELVEVFSETYIETLSELKNAIENNDLEVIERSAHSMKGMVANFFAKKIQDDCYEAEQMGKTNNLKNINEVVNQIEQDIPILLQELKSFLEAEV